jgi:ribonuclease HI
MQLTLHTDGGARGNPGPSGAGATITDEHGDVVARISQFLGTNTNNAAEYEALSLALHAARDFAKNGSETNLAVYMDSELIVKQMQGAYKVKHPALIEKKRRVDALIGGFRSVVFHHVPRAKNAAADRLANEAMDRGA